MDNLDTDTDDIPSLPKHNPRQSTIYEHSMKFQEPFVNESNIQMLHSPLRSDLLLTHLNVPLFSSLWTSFVVLNRRLGFPEKVVIALKKVVVV